MALFPSSSLSLNLSSLSSGSLVFASILMPLRTVPCFFTANLFFFAPIIKRAFETGETLCIDEFDESLHPLLVHYLVGLFIDPEVNKKNAQLIVSTHTSGLLNLKALRRDQIYFVEKDRFTGCSTLYSLDEFSPRTREDIQKAYLLGRYGSIPNLGNGDGL